MLPRALGLSHSDVRRCCDRRADHDLPSPEVAFFTGMLTIEVDVPPRRAPGVPTMPLPDDVRDHFDRLLEGVLARLPPVVHDLIDEVPLVVEDYPSAKMMHELGIRYRDDLQGLYTGVSLPERSVSDPGRLPDVITIFREGIINLACAGTGEATDEAVAEQIQITILHEVGHHFGLSEEDLEGLGYG